MPTEFINGLIGSFNQRLLQRGEPFQLVRDGIQTGQPFKAIMISVPPLDPRLPLQGDIREASMIETRRDLDPGLRHGDVLLQIHPLYELSDVEFPSKWTVRHRVNNPVDFTIKYWVTLVSDQDSGF